MAFFLLITEILLTLSKETGKKENQTVNSCIKPVHFIIIYIYIYRVEGIVYVHATYRHTLGNNKVVFLKNLGVTSISVNLLERKKCKK